MFAEKPSKRGLGIALIVIVMPFLSCALTPLLTHQVVFLTTTGCLP